jgi:hypothetical protein
LMSLLTCTLRSSAEKISTGAVDLLTVRSVLRVPVTMIVRRASPDYCHLMVRGEAKPSPAVMY